MANSEQNDLEKLLKDNLSDKTASVPDFVWDNIEAELFPEKKRRGFFWLFFVGLGLLAGGTAVYFMIAKPSEKTQVQLSHNEAAQTSPYNRNDGSKDQRTTGSNSGKATSGKQKETGSDVNVPDENAGINRNARSQGKGSAMVAVDGLQAENPKNISKNAVSGNKRPNASTVLPGNGKYGKQAADSINPSDRANQLSDGNEDPKNNTTVAANGNPTAPETKNGSEEAVKTDSSETQKAAGTTPKDSVTENPVSETNAEPGKPGIKNKRFIISVYGGASLYDMAVFKDYFTSGQLSNRPFESSGFELGAGFGYKLTRKLGIYAGAAFNQKNTSFDYDLAITESDYFDHLLQGELLPLATIIDNGAGACFLAKDVQAKYQVNSWLLSIGSTYDFLQWKKFSVGADLRLTANIGSALQMKELTVLQVQPYGNERFNYLKIGAGLNIGYQVTDRFSVGISPMYHLQFNKDKQSFYKGLGKELVLPVRLGFCF